MNKYDRIAIIQTIKRIMGGESEDNSGPKVVELASFHVDFPEDEMAMNPEDITWPAKLEGPISYDYLVEKYEIAVKKLEKYRHNLNAMIDFLAQEDDDFAIESDSTGELTARLIKEKLRVNKRIGDILEVLTKAKEHDVEETIQSMRGLSLDKNT